MRELNEKLEKNKLTKQSKGITLIALVITIIVLLILAGVTIATLTGDNGLLQKAGNAKEKSEQGTEKEQIKLAYVKAKTDTKPKTKDEIKEEMQTELNSSMGANKTVVTTCGDGFDILVIDKNYYYTIEENDVNGPDYILESQYPGDITKNNQLDGDTLDTAYQITCIEDLVAFSNMTNGNGIRYQGETLTNVTSVERFDKKHIVLTKNLNFASKYSYANSERTDFGDINGDNTDGNSLITEMTTGTGWRTTGNFCGTFDGKNNIIKNLYVNRENGSLFGLINSGTNYSDGYTTICNLGVIGNIKGRAGIVMGFNHGINTELENLFFIGKVENTNNSAGGIIAYSDGYGTVVIKNCYTKGEIIGTSGTGGIIGVGRNTTILNCHNEANVTGTTNVGGICGKDAVEIKNCYNTGTITAKTYTCGGIYGAGQYYTCNIYQCYNTGTINGGSQYVGGIASSFRCGIIEQCYNKGIVYAGRYSAGIGGGSQVLNCYNAGEIYYSEKNRDISAVGGTIVVASYNVGTFNSIGKKYGVGGSNKIFNSFYLAGCGATDNKAPSLDSNGMKNLTNTLNKAFTISEDGEVTVKEDGSMQTVTLSNGETTNVWKADTNNINDGYPILSWQEQ